MKGKPYPTDLATPRTATVLEYNTETGKWTVISEWNGNVNGETIKSPEWAAGLRRCASTDSLGSDPSEDELMKRTLAPCLKAQEDAIEAELDAWGEICQRDHERASEDSMTDTKHAGCQTRACGC